MSGSLLNIKGHRIISNTLPCPQYTHEVILCHLDNFRERAKEERWVEYANPPEQS